ncbi:MAG: S-layer homology domain-containing protein [Monoglobales bacterium]
MKSKIISAVSAAALASAAALCAALPVSADTSSWSEDQIMPLLDALGIMQGDGNGDYGLERYVSRAEMAKIAVNSSVYKDETALGLNVSPFSDVDGYSWSAPYILNGVTNGLINGYLDGTFRPDDTVNYEEATTMLLKVLGYTDDYFGVSYPYGQVGLAKNINLLDDIDANYGQPMTRGQIARMVYNALDIEMVSSTVSSSQSSSSQSSSQSTSQMAGANTVTGTSGSQSSGTTTTTQTVRSSAGQKLISNFDATFNEDVIIIATPDEDNTLGTGKVSTSIGKYNMYDGFDKSYLGLRGDMVVRNDKDILCFVPDGTLSSRDYNVDSVIGSDLELDGTMIDIDDSTTVYYKSTAYTYASVLNEASKGDTFKIYYDTNGAIEHCVLVPALSVDINTNSLDKYVIYSVLNNTVVGYKDGVMSEINLKDTTSCYKDTTAYSYANVKNEMEMGDVLKVKYKSDGEVDYVIYESGNMEGPIKVSSSADASRLDASGTAQVMRDGNRSSLSDIQANDIVYYSEDLNMLLAYSTKVSGVYQSASPSRDNPTTVTVSGKEYEVEGVDAYNDLSSSGPFKYGDTITLCLGKDGKSVAGVVTSSTSVSGSQTGYVTAAGKKNFSNNDGTTYSSNYVDIVAADGVAYEYAVTTDASSYVGSVVRVNFNANGSSISSVSSPWTSSIAGTVDASNMTIGSNRVAENCAILDTTYNTEPGNPIYKRVFLQRLDGLMLGNKKDILYFHKNSAGEIDELILNEVTGDFYKYGITLSAESPNYIIDIDGTQYTSSGSSLSLSMGTPCRVKINDGNIITASSLKRYPSTVSVLTQTTATIGNTEYKLSDEVVVYEDRGILTYNKISLNDAINGDYTYTAYYDKEESNGGRIRVIIAKVK